MTRHRTRSEMTFTLRVVSETFDEDEAPSLPGMPVYDTTAEAVPEPRQLAKCPAPARQRKAVRS